MKIIYDIATKNFFDFGFSDLSNRDRNVSIGFLENGKLPVEFSQMTFSLEIALDDETLIQKIFPEDGGVYVSTDDEIVAVVYICHFCHIVAGKNHLLRLSVTNDGETSIFEKNFKVDPVSALYPSWIFDEEIGEWVPPKPNPSEGDYYWEESLLDWIPVEEMIKRNSSSAE
jgi:hypothetical protein